MPTPHHIYETLQTEMSSMVGVSLLRLIVAAILAGLIGLERELKHRPSGLRTNLFICLGAAMYTILSDALAVEHIGDHTRIAAQIIPGIGFIGAGTIIDAGRDLLTGITSAATRQRQPCLLWIPAAWRSAGVSISLPPSPPDSSWFVYFFSGMSRTASAS